MIVIFGTRRECLCLRIVFSLGHFSSQGIFSRISSRRAKRADICSAGRANELRLCKIEELVTSTITRLGLIEKLDLKLRIGDDDLRLIYVHMWYGIGGCARFV